MMKELNQAIEGRFDRLSSQITTALQDFEKDTGLTVTGVSLIRMDSKKVKNRTLIGTQIKIVF